MRFPFIRSIKPALALAALACSPLLASEGALPNIPLFWATPFALLLACIAIMPFVNKHFWEHYYAHISIGLGILVVGLYTTQLGSYGQHKSFETALEYFKFIALVGSLFVVSGGILIEVAGKGTPLDNLALLGAGLILANIVGTTGASVLLIRPFLRMNKNRLQPFHVVFFIFIVSNCAGALTPIGDPPLFLGYINGVPFTWTMIHCFLPWLTCNALLMAIFFFLDRREAISHHEPTSTKNKVIIRGASSILCLCVVLFAVFIDRLIAVYISEKAAEFPTGAILMVLAAILAHRTANPHFLRHNEFSFGPIKEVAFLFVGIFATMMPALDWLTAHAAQLGFSSPAHFYFGSGSLSAFLDNAPTYLNFLGAAHGLKGVPFDRVGTAIFVEKFPLYLLAVSLGSVFFGACSYIGNGPNFMVKAIADSSGAKTPSFFEYIWKYALPILIPIYTLIWWIFLSVG